VGEAGKVYFAQKVQAGEWPVAEGTAPPYYPSVHGLLTHAVVGGVGRLIDAETSDLFTIGRVLSVLLTGLALGLLASVGRRLGVPWAPLGLSLVLWMGTQAFLRHAVSYRPDNWLLFLSALAIWVLSHPKLKESVRIWVLLLLPTLSFHVKAPGLAVGLAIFLAVGFSSRWKRAFLLGLGQGLVLFLSLLWAQLATDGVYFQAFSGGVVNVGLSFQNSLAALIDSLDPVLLLLILGPLAVLPKTIRLATADPSVRVLTVFWGLALPVSVMAAVRNGSDSYYFMEVGTFGLLLSLAVLSRWHEADGPSRQDRTATPGAPWILVAMATLLSLPVAATRTSEDLTWDVALVRSTLLAETRPVLARRINAEGLYCYSDDPGLNILLHRPAVIYPLLEQQMMGSGVLEDGAAERAVHDQTYDCVVSSGINWSFRGKTVIPPSYWRAVEAAYPRIETLGRYRIFFPE
jgi:hypothetical protein